MRCSLSHRKLVNAVPRQSHCWVASLALISTLFTIAIVFSPAIWAAERLEPQAGIFLVAAKSLSDPNFEQSVVLLLEHGPGGSLGLIINRRLRRPVVSVIPQLRDLEDDLTMLHFGGPVQASTVNILAGGGGRQYSLHPVTDGIYIVAQAKLMDILRANKRAKDRVPIHYYAGYAGWTNGQLAHEIARGDWHLTTADAAIVFLEDPSAAWQTLIEHLDGRWVMVSNRNANVE